MALTKLTNIGAITAALTPVGLAEAVASKSARAGQSITITDRADGVFVYTEGQTANGYNIVACTGVPTLSLVLRIGGFVNAISFGLNPTGNTDDSVVMQAAVNIGLPVYLPSGSYQFGNIVPSSNRLTVYGDGSLYTQVTIPDAKSGYIFNTQSRYSIIGMVLIGRMEDGVYGIGADGVGESGGGCTLEDLRFFNFDECIRFGGEYEHPLGLKYEKIYCQNFLTAGIDIGNQTIVSGSGESAWDFINLVVTNPSFGPVEYSNAVTPNTPSATQDTIDWTGNGDNPRLGYMVIRSLDNSTDWHVPPNWTDTKKTGETFIATKSSGETWFYKTVRMTVGCNIEKGKAVSFDTVQTEYCGIGLRAVDIKALSIGTHYTEVRDTNSLATFAGIAVSLCEAFDIGTMWGEQTAYNVFVQSNSSGHIQSIRSSQGYYAAIGINGGTDSRVTYGNVVLGSTPQVWRSPNNGAQDYNYDGVEYTSGQDYIHKISHTTKSGFEVGFRGAKKGGIYAGSAGATAELNALDLRLNSKTMTPVVINEVGSTTLTQNVLTNILTVDTNNNNDSGSIMFHYSFRGRLSSISRQAESGTLLITNLNVASATPVVSVLKSNNNQVINNGTLTLAFGVTTTSGGYTIHCTATTTMTSNLIELTPISLIGNLENVIQL